ncbi:hypothetical protein GE061_010264 [Apolygus lucorum]|uniref:Uncharacterized protein n=1 Tax=Apolygus lucorum TaxID=248454 RepID=A0A8S9Y429_APOLU|nr:hypothetical protein GE061_010264 [Apolygus lucorum]
MKNFRRRVTSHPRSDYQTSDGINRVVSGPRCWGVVGSALRGKGNAAMRRIFGYEILITVLFPRSVGLILAPGGSEFGHRLQSNLRLMVSQRKRKVCGYDDTGGKKSVREEDRFKRDTTVKIRSSYFTNVFTIL